MNAEKFIIFLDIDGVICSYDENIYMPDFKDKYDIDNEHFFKKSAIDALNCIIDYFNADLCMISSWNSKFKDEESYKQFLLNRGIHVNALTFGKHYDRAKFIESAIENKEVMNYLIIDDEASRYFQCHFNNQIIEYKRILKPNRNRCLDMYDSEFHCKWIGK